MFTTSFWIASDFFIIVFLRSSCPTVERCTAILPLQQHRQQTFFGASSSLHALKIRTRTRWPRVIWGNLTDRILRSQSLIFLTYEDMYMDVVCMRHSTLLLFTFEIIVSKKNNNIYKIPNSYHQALSCQFFFYKTRMRRGLQDHYFILIIQVPFGSFQLGLCKIKMRDINIYWYVIPSAKNKLTRSYIPRESCCESWSI